MLERRTDLRRVLEKAEADFISYSKVYPSYSTLTAVCQAASVECVKCSPEEIDDLVLQLHERINRKRK